MFRKLKYNGSGCIDMTAYQAILNIEMENRRNHKKDKKERRKSNERSTNLGKSKS